MLAQSQRSDSSAIPSFEQDALDELRDDGSDLDLKVPLLSVSGRTGMYCTANCTFTGSGPSFTTLPTPRPTGAVQTFPEDAFQSGRMLPEYPTLQPSPIKTVAMG